MLLTHPAVHECAITDIVEGTGLAHGAGAGLEPAEVGHQDGSAILGYEVADRFDPRRMIQVIREKKPTTLCVPGTVYRFGGEVDEHHIPGGDGGVGHKVRRALPEGAS